MPFLLSALLLCGLPLVAQEDEKPRAPQEDLQPGLVLSFAPHRKAAEGDEADDRRVARGVMLYVPGGAPPSPFLEAGQFRARWEGYLEVEFFDDFTFSLEGRGAFRLELDGNPVLAASGEDLALAKPQTVELEGGPRRIVATYESPAEGDAWVRLFWSSYDFAPEPIAPDLFRHSPGSIGLREGTLRRRGRELVANRHCWKCHEGTIPEESLPQAMPELAADAPSLADAGDRLETVWMARWLASPRQMRWDARMPRSLQPSAEDSTETERDRARHVAAFLATLRQGTKEVVPARELGLEDAAIAARGEEIANDLGCMACHILPGEEEDEPGPERRTPLARVASKWKPSALVEFLLRPEEGYAWVRMPDFQLTVEEARALTAFLLSRPREKDDAFWAGEPGDAERGLELFRSTGCLNCHPLEEGPENLFRAPSFAEVASTPRDGGCLSPEPAAVSTAPDFGWSEEDVAALRHFLSDDRLDSLQRYCAAEFAERQVAELRCTSCHQRDGQLDHWSTLSGGTLTPEMEYARAALEGGAAAGGSQAEGEQSELDQSRPYLTWVGEKLRNEWMARLLAGEIPYRVRPWLRARMPSLSASSRQLAEGLAHQQGISALASPPGPRDEDLAKIGRQLAARERFSCNSCHDVGGAEAFGVFDAKGPNFIHMAERLRKDFFHRWMRNPLRIAPTTKMPQFADDEGVTSFVEFYDGDGTRQFEAIWHYFLGGSEMKPPD